MPALPDDPSWFPNDGALLSSTAGDPRSFGRISLVAHDGGHLRFAASFGVLPQLGIAEAAFTWLVGPRQSAVHVSGRAPRPAPRTTLGPVSLTTDDDGVTLCLDLPSLGVEAELLLLRSPGSVVAPRHRETAGVRLALDRQLVTDLGYWRGHYEVDGERHLLDPSRDQAVAIRTWGIEPIDPLAGLGAPDHELPAYLWHHAIITTDDATIVSTTRENPHGNRWHHHSARVPATGPSPRDLAGLAIDLTWQPCTRWPAAARARQQAPDGDTAEFATTFGSRLLLRGLGSFDPHWGHGWWHDELAIGRQDWRLDALDPEQPENLHALSLGVCHRPGTPEPIGSFLLETLAVGAHHPSGLGGFLDGVRYSDGEVVT